MVCLLYVGTCASLYIQAIGLFCVCVCVGKGITEERFCLFIFLRRPGWFLFHSRSARKDLRRLCLCYSTPFSARSVFLCAPLIAYQQQPMEKQPDKPKVSRFFLCVQRARTHGAAAEAAADNTCVVITNNKRRQEDKPWQAGTAAQ